MRGNVAVTDQGFTSPSPKVTPEPEAKRIDRQDELQRLINTNLPMSSTQPNVAMLIDASGDLRGVSVGDKLHALLTHKIDANLIGNLADIKVLKERGIFDELFGGNSSLIRVAHERSKVDYVLLGKATYSFRAQSSVQADLLACDLVLTYRLFDHSAAMVRANSLSSVGAGFTNRQALENASEGIAQQLLNIADVIQ